MAQEPKIYIRRKTQMMLKGTVIRSILTLQARRGTRGVWNIAGDETGIYDFASEEGREAKIQELLEAGAILK